MEVLAVIVGVVAIWTSRTVVLRRRRTGQMGALSAAVVVGVAWALVPLSFALLGPTSVNWVAVSIAAAALGVGSGATTYYMTRNWRLR
jgi:uncharacterized membrane-anchored protein